MQRIVSDSFVENLPTKDPTSLAGRYFIHLVRMVDSEHFDNVTNTLPKLKIQKQNQI